jgi:two-component system sensor histidine kinase KdpD
LQRTDVDWDEATRRDFLSDVERETDRLAEFVDDLLDITLIDDTGLHTATRARARLSALVAAGLDRVRHMLAGRELHIRISDELPTVEVDAARVEHVVANLVENAAKYTPADTRIRVIGKLGGDQVELAVEDEGPGIAADYLERIFDRFFRGRMADNVPDIGLGLAIGRSIVQAEGGSIWAENRPSGGARFVVTLPLNKPQRFATIPTRERQLRQVCGDHSFHRMARKAGRLAARWVLAWSGSSTSIVGIAWICSAHWAKSPVTG